jgi:hypothetical protein
MESTKVYAVSRWVWLLPIAVTGLVGYNFLTITEWVSNIFFVAMGLLGWYSFFAVPHKVSITPDNWVVIEKIFGQSRVRVEDILVVERDGKTTTLKHRAGKIQLSYIINHLDDFATQLKKRNPLIEETEGPMLRLGKSPAKMMGLIVIVVALALVVVALAVNFPTIGQLF